ncbi:MAG: OsmC family protein [Candidatus Hodarchaeales archaeon]
MEEEFTIRMEKTGPMQFTTTFDKNYPKLKFDEPPEAGGADEFPNARRVLTAAVANCLSASFTFCLTKSRIPIKNIETRCTTTTARNKDGYWRIKKINVTIFPVWDPDADEKKKKRCIELFRNYCIVSSSVENGIELNVDVKQD